MTPDFVTVTFFTDYAATTKRQQEMALGDLVHLIETASAPSKGRLPWLKLARFGNFRTVHESLRHDRNLIAISGIEADYDGEQIGFDEALEIAAKVGLLAILYTSPSHTPERPRWRVLCPTSRELPPADRARLVARINGLYRGTLATESFTLSQSYYFGSVNGNPAHQVVRLDGIPIDLLDELDASAVGKSNGCAGAHTAIGAAASGLLNEAALTAELIGGTSYHVACVRLVGKWAQQGIPMMDAQCRLLELFDSVLPPDRDARWEKRRRDVPRIVLDIYGKQAERRDASDVETKAEGVHLDDFWAYMPMHNYIFAPARAHWPGSSVKAKVPPVPLTDTGGKPMLDENGRPRTLSPTSWLDRYQSVEQMTWAPGLPMIVEGRLAVDGGWIERNGVRCFNLYLPPTIAPGDARLAEPWVEHVRSVYPGDAEHVMDWLAHRVQRPHEKINHALVLGGEQGIGKDTILEPIKHAVGPWNFAEVSPKQVFGRFNGFLKSVVLRISEARDLGEHDRFEFYDHLKTYTAAPPDVLRVDEKNLREHPILNVCGIVITTNHKTDGIYLPPDDRRHFIAWSDLTKDDRRFLGGYWGKLWRWYKDGGLGHVNAFLRERDLSGFDAKAPPPKTAAFWAIVDAGRAPEDSELADVLDKMGNPDALTLLRIINAAPSETQDWLRDRKNRKSIPHRLERCGYVRARNPDADDGLWKISDRRQAVYAKAVLSFRDQLAAVHALLGQSSQ